MNLQRGNVGNRGDVLKHVALVDLALQLKRRHPGEPINYLETHAFQMTAPLACSDWKGAGAYGDLQRPYVERGAYLCSVGLAAALLPEARLYLSESDPETRKTLQRQLKAAGREPAALFDDCARWLEEPSFPKGPLLALVDPFRMTPDVWRAACAAVEILWRPGMAGALLAFDYAKEREAVAWSGPPAGWDGPAATPGEAPYFLAVYAPAGQGVLP